MPHSLHIISFDVPFPANYGGVIDVYYKLAWLKRSGVKTYLHCFTYGRKPSPELELLCEKVFYYERKTGLRSAISWLPYNVKSRMSAELEKNLLADAHPILFEVLHTCYLLRDKRFSQRKKIYRHSNIEHDYYNELAKSERNLFKKIYLKIEAAKLRRFEPILNFADLILAVNQKDTAYFKEKYPSVPALYLPSFHPNIALTIQPGRGKFILFHGNLGVSENYEAAAWLIKEVFSKLDVKCVIAGLNPPSFLLTLINEFSNITLVPDASEAEMNVLVSTAQIHILYTAQPTGLKLKLLNVLFNGRFILCNPHMLSGTGIHEDASLQICQSPGEFITKAKALMTKDFTQELMDARSGQVKDFDNAQNCEKLIGAVFGEKILTT